MKCDGKSGRPKTHRMYENVEEMPQLVTSLSAWITIKELNLDKEIVRNTLTEDLEISLVKKHRKVGPSILYARFGTL